MKYFGEGLASGMRALGEASFFALDVILPDVGFMYEEHGNAAVLSWPLVFPFGPRTVRHVKRHHCDDDDVFDFQPFRFVPELGVTLSEDAVPWMRLGYSVVLHAKDSKLGLVAGIGPTFAMERSRIRALLSPEVGVRLGRCCYPIYSLLLVRYEHALFGDASPRVMVKLGLSYW